MSIRKDNYQYKLIRMVDDYLVDKDICYGYEEYFIRSECHYNGSLSSELYQTFYFRPKNRKDENKLNLIHKIFGEDNLNKTITQNGVKMKVSVLGNHRKKYGMDLYEIEGLTFGTTKEWIDKELN